jgi:hypothetical protein
MLPANMMRKTAPGQHFRSCELLYVISHPHVNPAPNINASTGNDLTDYNFGLQAKQANSNIVS